MAVLSFELVAAGYPVIPVKFQGKRTTAEAILTITRMPNPHPKTP